MRALVTGTCGFVGRHLVRHLLACGDSVVGTYLVEPIERLKGVEYQRLDITSAGDCLALISQSQPEIVYHLAGLAFVPDAERDFAKTLSINVGGVFNVAQALSALPNSVRLVLVSSAEVYGNVPSEQMPINESHLVCPGNAYSLSKNLAELCVSYFSPKVTTVIARPFNHIGPGQDPRFMASSFAKQLADIADGKAERIIKVGNLDAKRDFTDVRDVVRAYRMIGEKGEGIYNIASGIPISVNEILSTLIAVSGQVVEVRVDPERYRPLERPLVYGNSSRLQKELGWAPEYPIEKTLSDIFAYWRPDQS